MTANALLSKTCFSLLFLALSHFLSAQNYFITGPSGICVGDCPTFFFNGDSTTMNMTGLWEVNAINGPTFGFEILGDALGDSETICFFLPGVYEITLTFDNPDINVAPFFINVSDFPTPQIFAVDNVSCPGGLGLPGGVGSCAKVCAFSTVTYTTDYQSSFPGFFEYVVTGAESIEVFGNNGEFITIEWGAPGTGTIEVYVNGFCQGYNSICVEIMPDPQAAFETVPPANNGVVEICEGQTVFFDNQSVAASSFAWFFGNFATSSAVSPEYTFESPGTYEVALIAYNACFCNDTTFLTIEVQDAETPFIDCVGTVCTGETVTYTTQADCSNFLWNVVGNGTILDGGGVLDDFITVQWNDGPEAFIELAVSGCTGTYCIEPLRERIGIITDQAPISGPDKVCKDEIVAYSIQPYDGADYFWTVSSGGTILGGQGTNEIRVEWNAPLSVVSPQLVQVVYDNCYLECSGSSQLEVNILNTFYLTGPIEVCTGETALFEGNDVLPGTSGLFEWALLENGITVWSSGGPSSDVNIPFVNGPGKYVVEATPADPNEYCLPRATLIVSVRENPPLPDSLVGELTICAGTGYTYEVFPQDPNYEYVWEFIDMGVPTTRAGNPVTFTWPNAAAPLSINVYIRDPFGCTSETVSWTPEPLSMVGISGPADICEEDAGFFTATEYAGVDYNWSVSPAGAASILSGQGDAEAEILFHQAGAVDVTVDVCGLSVTYPVNVEALPAPDPDAPAGLCPGDLASVVTLTTFDSYTWRDEDGNFLSSMSSVDLGPGHYEIEVSTALGCTDATSFFIDAYPAPDVYISTPDGTGFCPPISSAPTLYASETGSGYTYQWYFNGTPVGTNSSSILASNYGDYYVEVTNTDGCTALSNTINVFEFCTPVGGICIGGTCNLPQNCPVGSSVAFNIEPSVICNEATYTVSSTDFVPGSLSWDFGDGATSTNQGPSVTHTYAEAGFYPIILIGTSQSSGQLCYDVQINTIPVAANFLMENACAESPAQFRDLSTFVPGETIASWSWNFGDPGSGPANTSTDQEPTHTYDTPGSYTVALTITSQSGCTSTITQMVEVNPLPDVDFPIPSLDCEGAALAFEALVSANVVDIEWDFDDPASGQGNTSTQENTQHVFASPGSYEVTLTATNVFGCSRSVTKTVAVEPNGLAGAISPDAPSPICEGSSVTLTAPAGGNAWEWSTGETTETITVMDAGLYEVTLTDANGCSYTPAAFELEVIPKPNTVISAVEFNEFGQIVNILYDGYTLCEGESVTLQVPSGLPYSIQWSTGQTNSQIEFTEWRGNALDAGSYEFFIDLEDANGCTHTVGPFPVTVHELPDAPTITIDGAPCENNLLTLEVDTPDPALTYVWNTGETGTSISTTVAGSYFATAYNANGCTTESNRIHIAPAPDIRRIPGGCHTRCNPDTLCLPNMPGVVGYQWFLDGTPIPAPNGTDPELIATQSGAYTVEMVNSQGCVSLSDPLVLELLDGFGTIDGQVFFDLNDNGLIDGPDTLMAGIPIILLDENGVAIDTAFTNASGNYGFPNIPSNLNYTVMVDTAALPAGTAALFSETVLGLTGCDDLESADWLVIPSCITATSTFNLSACAGTTVSYNGTDLAAGTQTDFTFTDQIGCDSIVTVVVEALPTQTGTETLSACPGSSITYNGQNLAAGSTTDFTFQTYQGCDSVVTVTVEELATQTNAISLSACPGGTATYNGQNLAAGSTTDFTFQTYQGCDSVVTVTVEELATQSSSISFDACPGSSITYNGQNLAAGSTTDFTFQTYQGCDSVVTVTVNELTPSTTTLDLEVCPGETVTYAGTNLAGGTQTDFTFQDQFGCDSIVTVTVTETPEISFEANTEPSCYNAEDGQIELFNIQGGLGTVEFSLDGIDFSDQTLFDGLAGASYEVIAQDAFGCQVAEEVLVETIEAVQVFIRDATLPCESEGIEMEAGIFSPNTTVTWPDGSQGESWIVSQPGAYTALAENVCELIELPFAVTRESDGLTSYIYMPNVFSPDADGINDIFRGFPAQGIKVVEYELLVFDRWGNALYETTDPESGWDGVFRDRKMNVGVYVYYMQAVIVSCGETKRVFQEGDVTLIR